MKILEKLTSREKTILYILVAVVAAALSYGLLLEPAFKRWHSLDSQILLLKAKLQKALSLIKDKESIDSEYMRYAQRLRSSGGDDHEVTYMLNTLESIARASGVKIVNMQPKPLRDRDFYKEFSVELDAESNMQSLMKFIYDIRNSPILLKVDRLRLNAKRGKAQVIIRSSMFVTRIVIK